jgi:hypothetical protein
MFRTKLVRQVLPSLLDPADTAQSVTTAGQEVIAKPAIRVEIVAGELRRGVAGLEVGV